MPGPWPQQLPGQADALAGSGSRGELARADGLSGLRLKTEELGIMGFFHGKWIQIAVLACASLGGLANASTISRTGTFLSDDQVFQLNFTLPSAATVTIQSFGYGGGTNGASMLISQGGFATDLTVFSLTGPQPLIDQDSVGGTAPGACSPRNINSVTGLCLDGFLSLPSLAAGDYILTLTEQGNPANGPTFADGFAQAGNGNFTGGPFIDPFGNQMDGHWAVDVSATGLAVNTVPEPATVFLTLLSVSVLAMLARRRSLD
jgi:hypothetical protein